MTVLLGLLGALLGPLLLVLAGLAILVLIIFANLRAASCSQAGSNYLSSPDDYFFAWCARRPRPSVHSGRLLNPFSTLKMPVKNEILMSVSSSSVLPSIPIFH